MSEKDLTELRDLFAKWHQNIPEDFALVDFDDFILGWLLAKYQYSIEQAMLHKENIDPLLDAWEES